MPISQTGVCFTAGTEVKTEEGRKAIEEIEAGNRVYARNTETGEEGYKEVVRVFRKETKELVHIQIGESRIDTTPNHPFWVEGFGFREAGGLKEGDRVLSADGKARKVSRVELEILEEPVKVYNFEVADWHTYYVSGEEVLVHNTCMAGGNRNSVASPYDLIPTHSQTLSKKDMNKLIVDIKNNGINETIKYVKYNSQKYIVDGHHRLIAAKRLGLKEVPIKEVELPYGGYKTVEDLLGFD